MAEAIGMMEGAFFVPKTEIFAWINKTLKVNITKIESLASGSLYCQIFDIIHPGKLSLSKVSWKAKLAHEFINNYKILQQAFLKCNISKTIEVDRLARGIYQDNLEFAQWLKRYFDLHCGGRAEAYDAVAKRGGQEPDLSFAEGGKPKSARPITKPQTNSPAPTKNQGTSTMPRTEKKPLQQLNQTKENKPVSVDSIKKIVFSDTISDSQKIVQLKGLFGAPVTEVTNTIEEEEKLNL
eukprot:TRINITY_DN901_c0_g2_i5.p1 TRINITY_DN901_c0_g2~~TRINITY_DN901_c0_g2_i5.p1  ORF type:complete len:238 (-),score=55.61 TRINITY_DN901_c0_g2_i5:117-830(-)